jgi:hypothetical protein
MRLERSCYYFSTHGCRRSDSFLLDGALEELACAAACCRALRLKKSAMVGSCRGWGFVCGDDVKFKWNADASRLHEIVHRPCEAFAQSQKLNACNMSRRLISHILHLSKSMAIIACPSFISAVRDLHTTSISSQPLTPSSHPTALSLPQSRMIVVEPTKAESSHRNVSLFLQASPLEPLSQLY